MNLPVSPNAPRPDLIAEAYHGTRTNYVYGCRCDRCLAAMTPHRRRWHEKDLRKQGLGVGDSRHGTVTGYSRWNCRCVECRAAWRHKVNRLRAARTGSLAADDQRHGTLTGYVDYRCRCLACTEARRSYDAKRRAL